MACFASLGVELVKLLLILLSSLGRWFGERCVADVRGTVGRTEAAGGGDGAAREEARGKDSGGRLGEAEGYRRRKRGRHQELHAVTTGCHNSRDHCRVFEYFCLNRLWNRGYLTATGPAIPARHQNLHLETGVYFKRFQIPSLYFRSMSWSGRTPHRCGSSLENSRSARGSSTNSLLLLFLRYKNDSSLLNIKPIKRYYLRCQQARQ